MFINTDIFKIESNRAAPSRGKLLVAEPFLCDQQFARSVVLLTEHARKGSMGLMLNKPLPVCLNELMEDIDCKEQIPVFRGGP